MGRYWVGFDMGEIHTAICVIDEQGAIRQEFSVDTDSCKIAASLDPYPIEEIQSIVLEAGVGRRVARDLRQLGFPITVLNTTKTKPVLSVRQNKSDVNDARGLAELAKLGHPALVAVHVKSAQCQVLRSHLVMRNQMLEQKIDLQNALRSLMRESGLGRKLPNAKYFERGLEELLVDLPSDVAEDLRSQILPIHQILVGIRAYLRVADKRLRNACLENPITSAFLDIPGVGPICAMSFYTAVDDPQRFANVDDVGAYFGLVPRVKQSGTILHKSRITKAGNRLTRSHLFMAAGVLLTYGKVDSALRDWGLAISARSGRSKARVAVARKLAVLMLALWKSGEHYQPYPPLNSSGEQAETPTTCLEQPTHDQVVVLGLQ